MRNQKESTAEPASTDAPAAAADRQGSLLIPASRKETLSEVFWRMFVFQNSGLAPGVVFLVSLASLGWVVDSTLPIVQEVGQRLLARWFGWVSIPSSFPSLLIKLAAPAVLFLIVLGVLYRNARRNARPAEYASEAPWPHKGLIVMLSKYNQRYGKHGYDSPKDIIGAIEAGTLDEDRLFDGCNWGQLAFAVRYHAPMLQQCWVVVTKGGSGDNFDQAKRLIAHLVGRTVECTRIEIADENDIGETARVISNLYTGLSKTAGGISASDVIADFTGSTAAMSGGMIIATLNEREDIEYINQRISLTQAITPEQVRAEKIIISPRTSLRIAQFFARR